MDQQNTYSIYRGEGKQLTDAVEFFRDEKVIQDFLSAINQTIDRFPKKISILEIGAGTGILGIAIKSYLRDYGFNVNLVLSDRNTTDTIRGEGSIVETENKRLPFGKESFDLVISRSVTHYEKDDIDEMLVLDEVKRILKNEGLYITQSLYLPNESEIALHQELNSSVFKVTNPKTYSGLLDIHKKIFSKVEILVEKTDHPLVIDRAAYLKRYNLDESSGDILLKKIRQFDSSNIPYFWTKGDDFGWHINYAILVCEK